MDIISELNKANLVGLGGAGFPTWQKWQAVKESANPKRFLICNLSEGEPGVFKDEYILQNHLSELISGIVLAAETISAQKSYIFLNDKYKKYIRQIKKKIHGKKIEIFIDTGRYLCGEETVLLQVMEGKLRQPRSKPPYPTDSGLHKCPTLINNAETLYRAFQISNGSYSNMRYYSVSGKTKEKVIVESGADSKIIEIIPSKLAKNTAFAQIGGLSGYFIKKDKFSENISGTGAIKVFGDMSEIFTALYNSAIFLKSESCGKCTPCREGTYRIVEKLTEMKKSENIWEKEEFFSLLQDIAETASVSSFCGLGKSIIMPVGSALKIFKDELSK